MADNPLLKEMIDTKIITALAVKIGERYRPFDRDSFVKSACHQSIKKLELKDRIKHIATTLDDHLPEDYRQAVRILIDVAPEARGWGNWVLTAYVEMFGVDYLQDSLGALKELTKYGSSEFAIRPFMLRYPDKMMPVLHKWAVDKNEHVRRLAAEGSRPRGVWVAHLPPFKDDARPVLGLLERLKADPSLYVRKAVANNLNDISKDNPDQFLKAMRRWSKDGCPETDWIVKHASRTLIKRGDPRVMELFGFTSNPKVTANLTLRPKTVSVGDSVELSLTMASSANTSQKLAIDFRVHYVKASGKTSAKTFKWSERNLKAVEQSRLTRRLSFEDRSTRKHYPGCHLIEVTINGQVAASATVTLRG